MESEGLKIKQKDPIVILTREIANRVSSVAETYLKIPPDDGKKKGFFASLFKQEDENKSPLTQRYAQSLMELSHHFLYEEGAGVENRESAINFLYMALRIIKSMPAEVYKSLGIDDQLASVILILKEKNVNKENIQAEKNERIKKNNSAKRDPFEELLEHEYFQYQNKRVDEGL